MNLFQVIFIAFILVSIIRLIYIARKGSVKPSEFVFWIIIWLLGGTVIIFPQLSVKISSLFGISRGTDLITYSALIILYYLVFKIYVKIESIERKIKKLVTHQALENFEYENKYTPNKD